jgi:hypothetical protein
MSAATIAVIVVVVAVAVLAISAMTMVHRHRLRRRFGPEYDRVVGEKRSRLLAAAELTRREWRVQRLNIRPLTAAARAEYAAEWRGLQEGFVDQPLHAVVEADDLVLAVMKERGYPASDPNQIAADLSVTQPGTLPHYRAARQIGADADRGDVTTEDLRQALIHLRTVFGELLGRPDAAPPQERPAARPQLPATAGSRVPADTEVREPDGATSEPGSASSEPGAAASQTDATGGEPHEAGTWVPEKQLWRPAVRVPEPRTSEEEGEAGS